MFLWISTGNEMPHVRLSRHGLGKGKGVGDETPLRPDVVQTQFEALEGMRGKV